jgi:hypothetical protein
MQTDGAAPRRRAGTRPKKRRRLSVLLATAAVVVMIATVALVVMWAAPLARSGAGAQDANPSGAGAGSAIIHDDAGNVNDDYSHPLPPGKAEQLNAGSVVIHDDAGAVHPYTTPEEVDPWVNNLRGR